MNFDVDVTDVKSVLRAEKYLRESEAKFTRAISGALDDMEKFIRDKLMDELATYGLLDSDIAGSIRIYRVGTGLQVVVGSDYAMYVEFGTGIYGEQSPHPNPSAFGEAWEYDINDHGKRGWWYPTTEDDPNPYKSYSPDGQIFAWTAGSQAKPFMYNTWLYARRIANQVFQKHFRRQFG